MDRRFVPLLPALRPIENNRTAQEFQGAPIPKRRRIGVSVACETCRRKKTRCDGQRPVCTNCLGSTSQCTYRDISDLSHESRNVLIEVVQILNTIPASEALRTLRLLSTETNGPIILSTLRDEARAKSESATASTSAATDNDVSEPLEFELQNPIAYPAIAHFIPTEVERQPIGSQSESMTEGSISSLDSLSGEDPPCSSERPYELAYDLSGPSLARPEDPNGVHRQTKPPNLCDSRLQQLDIRYWTDVPIDNDMAAKCISLYLETDHPLLGHFDPDLFISDLVSKRTLYCSSLLVNALLYWASQMYSCIDTRTNELAMSFCKEAERLWNIERASGRDSLLNAAAAVFLCLGYLGQGRNHALLAYASEASNMGVRMGLFGIDGDDDSVESDEAAETADDATRARMHAAWGIFNWITLMSLFYRQPGLSGLTGLRHPPRIAIPEHKSSVDISPTTTSNEQKSSALKYMGDTFPHICRFWCIVHEVSLAYCVADKLPLIFGGGLAFAEFKFRELLAWSNNLPSRLSQGHQNPHHVQILHLWFHAVILDIFRPHTQIPLRERQRFRTFSNRTITPDAVCEASVAQLKHLISNYRLNYASSGYTILWHTALIYVINAILCGNKVKDWYSDLLICIYAYESLGRSWRVAACIVKGLLSLAMEKSEMSSRTARRILNELERRHPGQFLGPIRATFMADLKLALSEPSSATVERLAAQFEDNVLLKEYTTSLDADGELQEQQARTW